jgi:hypothetical protein
MPILEVFISKPVAIKALLKVCENGQVGVHLCRGFMTVITRGSELCQADTRDDKISLCIIKNVSYGKVYAAF